MGRPPARQPRGWARAVSRAGGHEGAWCVHWGPAQSGGWGASWGSAASSLCGARGRRRHGDPGLGCSSDGRPRWQWSALEVQQLRERSAQPRDASPPLAPARLFPRGQDGAGPRPGHPSPPATYQLRQHLLQLVHVHTGQVLCLGLPDTADGRFCRDTGGECGVEKARDPEPQPPGPQPQLLPDPCWPAAQKTGAVALKHRACLGHSAKGTRGKMGTAPALVSPLEDKTQEGPEWLAEPRSLGSPTTKILSNSAASSSASPPTARRTATGHRRPAPPPAPRPGPVVPTPHTPLVLSSLKCRCNSLLVSSWGPVGDRSSPPAPVVADRLGI